MSQAISKRVTDFSLKNSGDFGAPETVKMTINPEALGRIMDRLIELYKNPINATVREVLSNAIDATNALSAKGKTVKPVEVEMPTTFSKEFVVRDHGVGMSKTFIKEVFSTYGGTSKTSESGQIGGFGLGAKAPLAYSPQFYMETTDGDGYTTTATVSRYETGPETSILSNTYTGKASGTVVKIPVESSFDISGFNLAVLMYKNFSFDVPIVINGDTFFGNKDYIEFGEIVTEPSTGRTGRVWVRANSFENLVASKSAVPTVNYAYLLSGYLYTSPNSRFSALHSVSESSYGLESHQKYADFIVELKPKIVDFTSSRDEITSNGKIEQLDRTVLNHISTNTNYILENLPKVFKSGKVGYYDLAKALSYLKFSVEGKKVTLKLGMNSKTFDLKDFSTSEGKNYFADLARFNKKSVIGVVAFGDGKNALIRTSVSDSGKQEVFPSNFSITDLNYHLNVSLSEIENGHEGSRSLLGSALLTDKSSNYHIYVITGMNDPKKIARAIRARTVFESLARKAESDTGGRFHGKVKVVRFILDSRETISLDEQKAFIETLPEKVRKKVKFIDDDFVVETMKKNRVSKPVSATSENTIPLVKISNGFDSFSEMLKVFKNVSLQEKEFVGSGNFKISSIEGRKAIIIVTDKHVSLDPNRLLRADRTYDIVAPILNGFSNVEGFRKLRNRPIYITSIPVKKTVIDIKSTGATIIRNKTMDTYHRSLEAQKILSEAKGYSRNIDLDLLLGSSKEDFLKRCLSIQMASIDAKRVLGIAEDFISKAADVGLSVPNIETLKNTTEKIIDGAPHLPYIYDEEVIYEKFGKDSGRELVKRTKIFTNNFKALIDGWGSSERDLKDATKLVSRGSAPTYVMKTLLRFIENKFEKLDFDDFL